MDAIVRRAARAIRHASYLAVSTRAGISVECGIPPFRGPGIAYEIIARWQAAGLVKAVITPNVDSVQ